MREIRFAQFFLIRLDTLKDFKNAKMKFIKFTNFFCINFIEILQQ